LVRCTQFIYNGIQCYNVTRIETHNIYSSYSTNKFKHISNLGVYKINRHHFVF